MQNEIAQIENVVEIVEIAQIANRYDVTLSQAKEIASHTMKSFKKSENDKSQINESDIIARKVVCLFFDEMNDTQKIEYACSQLELIAYFAKKDENKNLFSILKNESKSIDEKIFTFNAKVIKQTRDSLNKIVRDLRKKK